MKNKRLFILLWYEVIMLNLNPRQNTGGILASLKAT